MSRRLAEQADRLDAWNYPIRFGYRTLYSETDLNRHLNNGAFGRLRGRPRRTKREQLAAPAFRGTL